MNVSIRNALLIAVCLLLVCIALRRDNRARPVVPKDEMDLALPALTPIILTDARSLRSVPPFVALLHWQSNTAAMAMGHPVSN